MLTGVQRPFSRYAVELTTKRVQTTVTVVRNEGIGSWTARRSRKTPWRTAVVYAAREWSYRELHGRVMRLAHALRELGARRGDRVAYLGPNHPAFLETLFATGMIGAVFVPLNSRLAEPELAHVLTDSGSTMLVAASALREVAGRLRDDLGLTVLGDDEYEALLERQPAEPIDEAVSLDDVCMIMYTSGTTGRPKGAVLTHGNITWNSVNVLVDSDLTSDEVTLVCAPLFHAAGLNMTCLPTILKGGTSVIMPAFDPDEVLDIVDKRRVTYLFGVPAMYDAIAASSRWPTADLSSLRTLTCGGAPVPESTIHTYLDRGLTFVQGYGMTEAAPGVLFLDRDQVIAKAGTAGVPHFFTDVAVLAPTGEPTPPGAKGEVAVHGPNVMRGYWDKPAETEAAFTERPDGAWFRSGDVAVVDDDGFVSVVDRVKDLIISGGENIYPAEVEDVLHDHPAVVDCAVIGVPDQKWGEVGLALIVCGTGQVASEREILDSCRGRLAGYKIPKSVRFVESLPRSASGKLLKNQLREQYQEKPFTG